MRWHDSLVIMRPQSGSRLPTAARDRVTGWSCGWWSTTNETRARECEPQRAARAMAAKLLNPETRPRRWKASIIACGCAVCGRLAILLRPPGGMLTYKKPHSAANVRRSPSAAPSISSTPPYFTDRHVFCDDAEKVDVREAPLECEEVDVSIKPSLKNKACEPRAGSTFGEGDSNPTC